MSHANPGRAALLAALIALATPAALAGSATADEVESTVIPNQARSFFNVSGPIEFAVVTGNLETGPQGTFGRFPANFETPKHIHSHGYQAVVISGQMTNPFEGEIDPPVMGPGSFWSVAANAVHSTACVSDTPCEFFMYAGAGFDFTPVE